MNLGRAAAALAAATISMCGLLLTTSAAHGLDRGAEDPSGDDIRVTVTELAPTLLDPAGNLVLSARVINASDQTLVAVGARLRVGSLPLTSRAELAAFIGGDSLVPVGTVPVASLVDVAPTLAPGASAQVRIEVPADQLGLIPGFGVHALTLELRVAEPTGVRRTAGSARTFLVTDGPGETPQVQVTWFVPLIGTPGRLANGILPVEAATKLAAALQPDGRLGALLAAGSGRAVTFLVDAALLEDVRSLATGRDLAAGAQPDPTAASWLAALAAERARAGSDVEVVPYADPDLVASQRAGLGGDLATARNLGKRIAGELLGGELQEAPAWPGSGLSNRATLRSLAAQGFGSVLLSASGLVPQTELSGTPDSMTTLVDLPDLPVVTSDATLAALLDAGPGSLGGPVLAKQRLLAETALIAAERPSDPRGIAVAPPRRWKASPGWTTTVLGLQAPWLTNQTLAELAAAPSDAPERTTERYTKADRLAEVSASQLAVVARDRERVAAFAPALAFPEPFVSAYEPALLSAQSTAWRGKGRSAGRAYTANLTRAVTADVTSVRLLERGQVTLSSNTGVIPLAVHNDLDQDVTVRVSLRSIPSVRLTSRPSELITVPAGRTATVNVTAEAAANARFPVVATLLSATGQPLGDSVEFTVRATGYGQVARIVVGGALVLLAIAVVVRVARRIRAAGTSDGETLTS